MFVPRGGHLLRSVRLQCQRITCAFIGIHSVRESELDRRSGLTRCPACGENSARFAANVGPPIMSLLKKKR